MKKINALPVSKKKFMNHIVEFILEYKLKHNKFLPIGTYYIGNVPVEIRKK